MVAVPLGIVLVGCVMVVVVVDMVIMGWVTVMVVVGSAGGIVVREVVSVFCDPSVGGSSGWSTSIGVMGDLVGPTPSPSGTGLIVYHLLASSTAMYTQRRSSSMKWIGRYSLSLCEKM